MTLRLHESTHAHSACSGHGNKMRLTLADFLNGKLEGLSRKERAAYLLPGVAFIAHQDVLITEREAKAFNPLLAKQRPSESTVHIALDLLRGDTENLVKIGNLGYYTLQSVKMFAKMCALASEALKLSKELQWLSQTSQSPEVLENSRTNDIILQQRQSIIDVKDFSTLACERHVTSFAIDTICLSILEESKKMDMVYLPCYSQTWAKQGTQFFNRKVSCYFDSCPADRARIIFLPVHFQCHNHWGFICFDTKTNTVYFDIVTVVRNMLSWFEILSNNSIFKLEK